MYSPWWSADDDGGGGVGGDGHMIQGLHVDALLVDFQVTSWDGVQDLQFIIQRNRDPALPTAKWSQIIPDPPGSLPVLLNKALGTSRYTLKVLLVGAKGVRFGVRANDAGAKANFAMSASCDFINDSAQA